MDRREALKKLGLGGAVAVSAPILLDSFNVALAASPYPTPGAIQAAGSFLMSANGRTLTISNIAQLFTNPTTFSWTDGAPAAPVLVFSSTNTANTSITTTTGNPPRLDVFTFTAVLTVDGNARSYQFTWSNTTNSMTVS